MNPEFSSPLVGQPSQPEPPAPPEAVHLQPTPSPEQLRAADAVFVEHQENSLAAGLVGLWSGALILNDLATEHFSEPLDEDEDEKEKKKQED
jgi:hypothetical protein